MSVRQRRPESLLAAKAILWPLLAWCSYKYYNRAELPRAAPPRGEELAHVDYDLGSTPLLTSNYVPVAMNCWEGAKTGSRNDPLTICASSGKFLAESCLAINYKS